VENISFRVYFVAGNSNKFKKWAWKKKSVEPAMCPHLGQWHMLYTSVHEKTHVNMSLHVH